MAIFDLMTTQMVNLTHWGFAFEVEGGGVCPLKALPPRKKRTIGLSRLIRLCRKRGSADWRIRVLVDNVFTGTYLHAYIHLLKFTRIVFTYGPPNANDGSIVPLVVGIKEKDIDYLLRLKGIGLILRRDNIWKKRPFIEIAPENVAPLVLSHENTTTSLRQVASSSPSAAMNTTTSPQRVTRRSNGGNGASATTIPLNSAGVAAEERGPKRIYCVRVLALRKFNSHINVLVFVLAFTCVGFVRFLNL